MKKNVTGLLLSFVFFGALFVGCEEEVNSPEFEFETEGKDLYLLEQQPDADISFDSGYDISLIEDGICPIDPSTLAEGRSFEQHEDRSESCSGVCSSAGWCICSGSEACCIVGCVLCWDQL